MDDHNEPSAPSWSASPSAKAKNAVQKSVTALLDELAPERVLKRADLIKVPIEQHRTPNGCVLQAAMAAVSVSWFPEAFNDSLMGELHVVVWRGVVARRGTPKGKQGATMVTEYLLLPIARPGDDCIWRGPNATEYDTPALAAYGVALLDEQMRAVSPPGSPS